MTDGEIPRGMPERDAEPPDYETGWEREGRGAPQRCDCGMGLRFMCTECREDEAYSVDREDFADEFDISKEEEA